MRHRGFVKSLKLERGFGFLSVNDGTDLFFHVKALAPDLDFTEQLLHRRVTFEIGETAKGPRAVNIQASS